MRGSDSAPRAWLAAGALAGALAVGLGAFGAHGLRERLSSEMLAVFETGVRYHLAHALALVGVAWTSSRWTGPAVRVAGWAFAAGILLFSGSLYLLAITGARWLGAVTPAGGVALLIGWIALGAAALRARPRADSA